MRVNDNNLTREQVIEDAGTTTVVNPLTITHNSTGTPAASFGAGLAAQAETTTTPDTPVGSLAWRWAVATHASRQTEVLLNGFVGSGEGALLRARTPASGFGTAPNAIGDGAVDIQNRRSAANQCAAGVYSTMVAGSLNRIDNTSNYAGILGGSQNVITSGIGSGILAGVGNTVTNGFGAIVGGSTNVVNAAGGFIGGGVENTIGSFGNFAVAFGRQAVSNHYGGIAFAGSNLTTDGDSQTVLLNVGRAVTHTAANWYELYENNNPGTPARLLVPIDTLYTFDILLSGATSGLAKAFGFAINGVIKNDGGTTSLLASNVTTLYDTDDVSYDARVTADDANDALLVEVSDADSSGDVVKWVATVRLASVTAA